MAILSRECAFFLPVVDRDILLVQRGTEPYKGYWCGAGGKASAPKGKSSYDNPWKITKMGGHRVDSLYDQHRKRQGLESTTGTAVREMREELFTHLKYFRRKDVTDIIRLGEITDLVNIGEDLIEAQNMFYIGNLNRADFKPSAREVTGIKKISELSADDQIVPITRLALVDIRIRLEQEMPFLGLASPAYDLVALSKQLAIDRFDPKTVFDNHRTSSMIGLICARTFYDSSYHVPAG